MCSAACFMMSLPISVLLVIASCTCTPLVRYIQYYSEHPRQPSSDYCQQSTLSVQYRKTSTAESQHKQLLLTMEYSAQ